MNSFLQPIYLWYLQNKRPLPWRETSDPYRIWLSEIILQQTRILQGISYYNKFVDEFPDVKKLAAASEDEILKLWQGLGYYSRARNLHSAAKHIVEKFNGNFPGNYQEIASLEGVGPYTAAAVGSIAFGLPFAAVDGNVSRFLSRFYRIAEPIDSTEGKKVISLIAEEILDPSDPGTHNQALMEFGALQCIPRNPDCFNCPVKLSCLAFQNSEVATLPVKMKKAKQTERYFYYFLIENSNDIFLQKREKKDIWMNLYELPLVELPEIMPAEEFINSGYGGFLPSGKSFTLVSVSNEKVHVLSHQILRVRFIHIKDAPDEILGQFIRANKKDIHKFAVPRLIENYFNEIWAKE